MGYAYDHVEDRADTTIAKSELYDAFSKTELRVEQERYKKGLGYLIDVKNPENDKEVTIQLHKVLVLADAWLPEGICMHARRYTGKGTEIIPFDGEFQTGKPDSALLAARQIKKFLT